MGEKAYRLIAHTHRGLRTGLMLYTPPGGSSPGTRFFPLQFFCRLLRPGQGESDQRQSVCLPDSLTEKLLSTAQVVILDSPFNW